MKKQKKSSSHQNIPTGVGGDMLERNILGKQNQFLWIGLSIIFCLVMILSALFWILQTSQGQKFFSETFPNLNYWLYVCKIKYTPELLAIPLVVIAILGLFVAKWLYEKTFSYCLETELLVKNNPAVGLYFIGSLLGIVLALLGSISGLEHDPLAATLSLCIALAIAIPAMRLAAWLQEKCFLYHLSLPKELVQDQNSGAGAVMCGALIGTGFILQSCFIGDCTDWLTFGISIGGAYIIGQIMFLIGGMLFKIACGYDFHTQLKDRNNIAAGIMLGSFLVALALVVSATMTNINVTRHFLVDATYQEDLKDNDLKEIRPLFQAQKIYLSETAQVTPSSDGGWNIVDTQQGQKIQIRARGHLALEVAVFRPLSAIASQLGYTIVMGFLGIAILLIFGKITIRILFPNIALEQEIAQKNAAVALAYAAIYLTIGAIMRAFILA